MLIDLPDVPPALQLLLTELDRGGSPVSLRKRLRGMLRDLRDQSETYLQASLDQRQRDQKSGFNVHLHGGLDVLSGDGCQMLDCRVAAVRKIATNVGLIADTVWLTDDLSDRFLDFGRPTNNKLHKLVADVIVLAELLPLIQAGIVKFRTPIASICADCRDEFERNLAHATDDALKAFSGDFEITHRRDGGVDFDTGACFSPPMILSDLSDPAPNLDELSQYVAERQIRTALWTAREASMTGGAVFSNSRIGLAGLMNRDGQSVDPRTRLLLEDAGELNLPAISDLTPEQVLQLRNEASRALPVFRERLALGLSASRQINSPSAAADIVGSLREDAAAVRAELEAQRSKPFAAELKTFTVLGLGISTLSIFGGEPLGAATSLLSVLGLLIGHDMDAHKDESGTISRPGYVLVKAEDILSHADH